MSYFELTFELLSKEHLNEAEHELESLGIKNLYSTEEPNGKIYLGGFSENSLKHLNSKFSQFISSKLAEIDWMTQWQLHCPYYQNGLCEIPLSDFGFQTQNSILLTPGAGFGDVSHATTVLMLKMMSKYDLSKFYILDIGSGSGILSIAAKKMRAPFVLGIDIDKESLKHSRENALLNFENLSGLEFNDALLVKMDHPLLVLMNMTFGEQRAAFKHYYEKISHLSFEIITSGILTEQKSAYLEWAKQYQLTLIFMEEKSGWLSFCFKHIPL